MAPTTSPPQETPSLTIRPIQATAAGIEASPARISTGVVIGIVISILCAIVILVWLVKCWAKRRSIRTERERQRRKRERRQRHQAAEHPKVGLDLGRPTLADDKERRRRLRRAARAPVLDTADDVDSMRPSSLASHVSTTESRCTSSWTILTGGRSLTHNPGHNAMPSGSEPSLAQSPVVDEEPIETSGPLTSTGTECPIHPPLSFGSDDGFADIDLDSGAEMPRLPDEARVLV